MKKTFWIPLSLLTMMTLLSCSSASDSSVYNGLDYDYKLD